MRQKSINIPGMKHNSPIPQACRVGNIVVTGGVGGIDRATGEMPPDLDTQTRNAFANLKALVEASGLDVGDLVVITTYISHESNGKAIDKYWLEWYPNPEQRPARHTVIGPIRGGRLVRLDAMGVAK